MSSCFNHLKLKFCLLKPSGAISWSKLKNLSISDVELDEESIQNILSGSPLLETLEFNECFGFRWIDITLKSVKNLVFCGYVHNYGRDIIEINVPYIQSLAIQYVLSLWKFSLHDVSSLVKDELVLYVLEVLSRLEAKGLVYPSGMKLSDAPSYFE
ncbi:F-box protein-like protein [Tanacetum coccineum]